MLTCQGSEPACLLGGAAAGAAQLRAFPHLPCLNTSKYYLVNPEALLQLRKS